jgi:hypothetical protein
VIQPSAPVCSASLATASLCHYQNLTNQIQIIQVAQAVPQRFEKVVFPRERVLFYATSEASLGIYSSTVVELTLIEQIPCTQLQVTEPPINH